MMEKFNKTQMKSRHPKYHIKKEDTLNIITKRFGVEDDVWKQYHNNSCRLDDIIREDIPVHLKEIFLLPELWGKENELNNIAISIDDVIPLKRSPLGYLNTLPYRKLNTKIKYGVNIEVETNTSSDTQSTQIDYEVSLQWYTDEEHHIVEINKISPTYINKQLPDLMIDQLASETYQTLYPIKFKLNEKGQIVGLYNLQEIRVRWEQGKQDLRKQWKGDWIEKYFKLIDKSLLSSFTFLKKMQKDWFLYAYFFNIRSKYTEYYCIEEEITYPFSPKLNNELKYTTTQKIGEYLDEHNRIQINIKGNYNDDITGNYLSLRLNDKTLKTETQPSGTYFARYYIDPQQNYIIDSCVTKCILKLEAEKIITVNISSFT